MLRPTKARTVTRFTMFAGVILLGACASEVTAPAATEARAPQTASMFVPSASAKALVGVADGTYTVTFDPTQNQAFYLGPNHLSMPAYSICNLVTSGYGADYWNRSCSPQTLPVTLTVIIKNAAGTHPMVSFLPAMRFNPTKSVQLFMYAPRVSINDAKNWSLIYCPDSGSCLDESKADASLTTSIDYTNNVLFRRVKHFSGYTVAERDSTGAIQ